MGESEFLHQKPKFHYVVAAEASPRGLGGTIVEQAAIEPAGAGVSVMDDARGRIAFGSAMILFTTLYVMTIS